MLHCRQPSFSTQFVDNYFVWGTDYVRCCSASSSNHCWSKFDSVPHTENGCAAIRLISVKFIPLTHYASFSCYRLQSIAIDRD